MLTPLTFPPQGRPGVAGPPSDYGSIRYDEVNATPIALSPGVPQPFVLAAPVMTTNSLRGPFAAFQFLDPDGKTIRARANGDVYFIRVRMSVTAEIAGGSFTTDLSVNAGTGVPSSTRPRSLLRPAGTPDLVDELFQAFPGAGFQANGAMMMLTASVPAIVTPQTMFILPAEAI